MQKLLYTLKECAEALGLSLQTVEALRASNQLQTVRVGRSVRVHVDALAAFAKTGTQNKTTHGQPLHQLWQSRDTK